MFNIHILVLAFTFAYTLKESLFISSDRQIFCKNQFSVQRRNLEVFIHKPSLDTENDNKSTSSNSMFMDDLIFFVFDHTSKALLSSFELFKKTTKITNVNSAILNLSSLDTHVTYSELRYDSDDFYVIRMLPLSIQDRKLLKHHVKKAYTNRGSSELVAEVVLNHINNLDTLNSIQKLKLRLVHSTKINVLHKEHNHVLQKHKTTHQITVHLPDYVPILLLVGNYVKFKLSYEIDYNYKSCVLSDVTIDGFKLDPKKTNEWYRIRASINTNKRLAMNDFIVIVKGLLNKEMESKKMNSIIKIADYFETNKNDEKDPFEVEDFEEFLDADQLIRVGEIDGFDLN